MLIRNLNENEYMTAGKLAESLATANGKPAKEMTTKWVRSALIQFSVVNEKHEREFSDDTTDTQSISLMDSRVIDLLADAIDEHNSFADTEAAQDALDHTSVATPAAGAPTT